MTSEAERTGERLWSLCNAATVFSAAQFVTLIFAMAGEEFRRAVAAPGIRPAIVVIVLLLSASQLYAIVWCNRRLAELEQSNNVLVEHIQKKVAVGRVLLVALFTVLSLFVLYLSSFSLWISKLIVPH